MFTPLHKIAPKALLSLKLQRQAEAALICEKYRKLAPEVIHAEALTHTRPLSYKQGTLTVLVENPAWAEAVKNKEKNLQEKINAAFVSPVIRTIKTRIGI